jgi:hypothetical protein
MKKLLALFAIVALSGCATGQYEAYSKATEAREKRLTAEATSRQLADQTLMLQVAKVANDCKDSTCQMGVLLVLSNLKNQASQAIQSAAPAIAAPVNEALEWGKLIVPAVVGMHANHLGTVLGLVNSTKGAADAGLANNGITAITPVSPFATAP